LDSYLKDSEIIKRLNKDFSVVCFSDFQPNPLYEDVVKCKEIYIQNDCDSIISIGGGSAIDTAKALKLFLPMNDGSNYLEQAHIYINIPHIAIPTTAGTGSESTRFSVIYFNGQKQSLNDLSIIPDFVLLDSSFLKTLPMYHKKATIMDALCQATESLWSVNANNQSIEFASTSIKLILENIDSYMNGDESVYNNIQIAANLSGKAINITQTTAAHAMSYKITSLFGIPHGLAVAVCMLPLWEMFNHNSFDSQVKNNIAKAYGVEDCEKALEIFKSIYSMLDINTINIECSREQFDILVNNVNPDRLKNHPIKLTSNDIIELYEKIVKII